MEPLLLLVAGIGKERVPREQWRCKGQNEGEGTPGRRRRGLHPHASLARSVPDTRQGPPKTRVPLSKQPLLGGCPTSRRPPGASQGDWAPPPAVANVFLEWGLRSSAPEELRGLGALLYCPGPGRSAVTEINNRLTDKINGRHRRQS